MAGGTVRTPTPLQARDHIRPYPPDEATDFRATCRSLRSGAWRPPRPARPQYLVMLVLWEQDQISVRDLGAALRLESSTLSPLLKRLEAAGHVRRERRSDDERTVTLTLTPARLALRDRACAVPLAMGEAMGLTEEQDSTVKELLRLLTDNVSRS
ncbi:MarR family winged helix-turn-helix transcriptional regulator [Streptomyces sp. KHY 26]|uniref:MarR family winged helix-turn-helix transcriptional regulator n=1 Tax=Streptomyces sp. KHY 26 TaxID=3097359 RepID=UPI00376EF62B